MSKDVLKTEWEFYQEIKKFLLEYIDEGRFVLIKGRKIISIYDTKEEALKSGYDKLGHVPMFIHKILEKDPVAKIIRDIF